MERVRPRVAARIRRDVGKPTIDRETAYAGSIRVKRVKRREKKPSKYPKAEGPGEIKGTVGGWRPGSGRKPGGVTEMKRVARARAAKMGMLPHEFLLAVMQGGRFNGEKPTLDQRIDCAKAAAPYYASKKPQHTHLSGADGGPVQFVSLSPEMLEAATPEELKVLANFLKRAEEGIASSGEKEVIARVTAENLDDADASEYEETLR